MKFLPCLLVLAGLCHAVDLDVESVGRDLNGWNGGVARYSSAGADFEVDLPTTATDADGNLVVTTVIRERKRGSTVFEGAFEATISPDGLVRRLSIAGRIDGREFDAGTVSRPEPMLPAEPVAQPAADSEVESPEASVAEVVRTDPVQEMRDSLGGSLRSAIKRARSSGKVVKRDLSARIFAPLASSADSLAQGVDALVRVIFRHSERS
jgi:hypothetical protein